MPTPVVIKAKPRVSEKSVSFDDKPGGLKRTTSVTGLSSLSRAVQEAECKQETMNSNLTRLHGVVEMYEAEIIKLNTVYEKQNAVVTEQETILRDYSMQLSHAKAEIERLTSDIEHIYND